MAAQLSDVVAERYTGQWLDVLAVLQGCAEVGRVLREAGNELVGLSAAQGISQLRKPELQLGPVRGADQANLDGRRADSRTRSGGPVAEHAVSFVEGHGAQHSADVDRPARSMQLLHHSCGACMAVSGAGSERVHLALLPSLHT